MTRVIDEIAAERQRQIEVEGWLPDHDDQHDAGELASAAACYAQHSAHFGGSPERAYRIKAAPGSWPWWETADVSGGRGDCPAWGKVAAWWKPKDPRRDLVRAAALIVAEIERLDRKPSA